MIEKHKNSREAIFRDGLVWYCVRTKRHSEALSARALRQEIGLEVFCPMIRFQRARRNKKFWVQEALFPCYMFAKFDFLEISRRVQTVRGVLKILKFGGQPAVVPDEVILTLREAVKKEDVIELESSISPGEEVQVIGGPFQGIHAIVTRILPAKKRVAILLELLGMEREVEVSPELLLPPKGHPLRSRG